MGCIDWYLYGQVDWEHINKRLKEWSAGISGALFGGGWWCMVDAIIYSKNIKGESIPFTHYIPGLVATLALIFMNLISREELAELSDSYSGDDEGAETRAKIWLFFSYIVAFGSVAGAAAVLIICVQDQQRVFVGVGGLLQTGMILASALMLWAFRSGDPEDNY